MPQAVEATAAVCTLLANATLLRRLCSDARGPVPVAVLLLQISGNALWISHSGLAGDRYLLATSTASLGLQVISLMLRWREEHMRLSQSKAMSKEMCSACDSTESLPQFS